MKNKPFIIIITILLLVNFTEATTCVYEFYGHGCPHCAEIASFLEELNQNPNIHLQTFEIYNNNENRILLNKYFEEYNIPQNKRGIPVVFIGKSALVGDKEILENLENKIQEFKNAECPSIKNTNGATNQLNSLSWITVASAALVDSINPCAIAVLLILLSALLTTTNKKAAIKAGLAFITSIYIVYFLFGLGLFSALQISGLSFYFYKVVGFLAIIIGLFNIKDYFWYGAGGFITEIPRAWRPRLKSILKKATSPLGAFLLGFVVCLFELPCTGGPYIFILGLLAEKTTRISAIPILLFYNLVFILPLIIIILLIYFGKTNIEKTNRWKERNIKLLHLITGIIMLGLGTIVVLGLI